MAESKDTKNTKDGKEGESFFRKVARFVANPATDWTDLNSRQEDNKELELEKSELKAMIERKRRNDFVRKREFDMLRKVRRDGLSPEQLASLGSSSKLDDSANLPDSRGIRPSSGVKAKIDEIEQQMVGDSFGPSTTSRKPPAFFDAQTEPAVLARNGAPDIDLGGHVNDEAERSSEAPIPSLPPSRELPVLDFQATPMSPPPPSRGSGLPPLAPMSMSTAVDPSDFGSGFAVEVSEVMHDPELDEAVIAFANADFELCEESLRRLTAQGGSRAQHAETWLVLFDHYRATGQQPRFESLAIDYAQQFGWSAPQWYSLPKMVAEAVALADERPRTGRSSGGDVGWVCPDELDVEALSRLRSQTLQMPLPWVFDWGSLRRIDAEAATQLSALFRLWAGQALEMRWIGGDRLFTVLQEAAPTGVRDADPAFWLTRLDALRLANRADQFDEAAIDYCVTYEVSPPSWEPARCNVRISGSGMSTRSPEMSMVSEANTGFVESALIDDSPSNQQVSSVELSGQLVGDIGGTLRSLDENMGPAPVVSVSCTRLIRVDFIAAGDLLNWVLTKRSENRAVHFIDAHRLVALFFGAMGINEHARVQVRKV
jgi:hypothetical protein